MRQKIIDAWKGIGIIRYVQICEMCWTKCINCMSGRISIMETLFITNMILTLPLILLRNWESTQYTAALAVSGAWNGTNRTKLYDELGWESLNDR